MTAEEARFSRSQSIEDMRELALFLGASSSSIEAINMVLREKYTGWLKAKEAHVPRTEKWSIRFLRGPGYWLTTGQRLDPDPTKVLPGSKLPHAVRLAVPIMPDGRMPMSLAPRREDLPRVANGRWRYVARPRGAHKVPSVTVNVPAPRFGVIFYVSTYSTDPVIARFPCSKGVLGAALKRLVKGVTEHKAEVLKARWDKEKYERKEHGTAESGPA